jgi:hypothetical protein
MARTNHQRARRINSATAIETGWDLGRSPLLQRYNEFGLARLFDRLRCNGPESPLNAEQQAELARWAEQEPASQIPAALPAGDMVTKCGVAAFG